MLHASAPRQQSDVIALAIFDARTLGPDETIIPETRMLLGIRSEEVFTEFANVISIPTLAIDPSVADMIIRSGDTVRIVDANRCGVDALSDWVVNLCTRRLGLADPLALGTVKLRAGIVYDSHKVVEFPSGKPPEEIYMEVIRVDVVAGAELFPSSTAHYNPILWTSVETFVQMWRDKDPALVGMSSKQAFGLCVSGLCMESAYEYLLAELNLDLSP